MDVRGDAVRETGVSYAEFTERIARDAAERRVDPLRTIPWDAPSHAIDPADQRWVLPAADPLGGSEWYRTRSDRDRSALGLHLIAYRMRVGRELEGVLKRALLAYAADLPIGDPDLVVIHQEVADEINHSLMFHEFVRRSNTSPSGTPPSIGRVHRLLALPVRHRPHTLFAWAGVSELVFDWINRQALRGTDLPPVLSEVMKIHVAEEARHISFARRFLMERSATLGRIERDGVALALAWAVPRTLGALLAYPGELTARFGTPASLLASVNDPATPAVAEVHRAAMVRPFRFLADAGLLTGRTAGRWAAAGVPVPATA